MTAYRDEHGRFRKRTTEDTQREYEAMSPWQKILRDQSRAQARRVAHQIVTDSPLLSALRRTSDEQGDMKSLHMNRTNDHRVFLPSGHVAIPWATDHTNDPWDQAAIDRVAKQLQNGIPRPPRQTITIASGHTLALGDVITITQGRPVWWRRALIWLRIIQPKPLRKFTVTGSASNTIVEIEGE